VGTAERERERFEIEEVERERGWEAAERERKL
jgi:hypothetical protein